MGQERQNKNSSARIQANNRYNAKAYDRINIAVPKGKKDTIVTYAKLHGESTNAYINRAIESMLASEENGQTKE